jgi:hypothetical protein
MDPELMQQVAYVFQVAQFAMLTIGLVGNLLTFLVFSRKKFQTNSISVYMRALAVADSFTFYRFISYCFLYFGNVKLSSLSNFMCKLNNFMITGLHSISIWVLVAFSSDKMIHALGKSQRFPFMNKKSFQLAVVIANALFHCIVYLFIPILIELKQTPGSNGTSPTYICALQNIPNFQYINIFDLFDADFVPLLLLMVTTSVTVRCLFKSRNNLEKTQQRSLRERRAKDVKFAINSISLNILAILFNTPISIAYLVNIPNKVVSSLFFAICVFFYTVNYSILFFVNVAFNASFRSELFLLLRIRVPSIEPLPVTANVRRTNGP